MEQLTPEDNLRLNVLLANQVQAIRIDEAKMVVYGLSTKGDAKVQLHPNCRDEIYLRYVRELLSGQILGSPGGYPTYLKRWNRMGQARTDNLAQLLLLGEPEAVVAVVHAPSLTPELARCAWWALPDSANARSLLTNSQIVNSELGPVLASYLVDYLPFEEEAHHIIESVRLILQPGLITETTRQALWNKGRNKNAYLVGFLWAQPDNLPNPIAARADAANIQATLALLITKENQLATQLVKVIASPGQAFLATSEQVLRKPANQEVVNILFEVIANYFAPIRPQFYDDNMNILNLFERAQHGCTTCLDRTAVEQREILALLPELRETIQAMLILSGLGYSVLRPIFSQTTAIGSLMRKKLAPVINPLLEQIAILQSPCRFD
jgi:hypothetical protein